MKREMKPDTILFPTPSVVVGSYRGDGTPNAMTVAWAGICSSEPPCIMISIRKERCTYENIMEQEAFTVNIPSEQYVKETDFFGLVSGRELKKFEAAGFHTSKATKVGGPIIDEFPFALECQLVKTIEIGQHVMIVGEIVNMQVEEECLNENGIVDIHKVKPLFFNPAENKYLTIDGKEKDAFSVGKIYI